MRISRLNNREYRVVTDTPMSDNTTLEAICILVGQELRVDPDAPGITVGPTPRVSLGAVSLGIVKDMAIGDELDLSYLLIKRSS